ncbi:hypothetical protein MRB53_009040 [Persea americana]|uniref:Uncharacterized protein n=1 Tax=Persea americana TaxID=3435 RepID=A0ACC2LNH6_PERAE|nr:hypothetical protein MRB53_009040 [Persea americana]
MDVWKTEQAQQKGAVDETLRPPLAPSEKNNAIVNRKPRTREVSSRYKAANALPSSLSTPAPRRWPSPNCSRTVPLSPGPLASKRAQSAERRRPATPPSPRSRPSTPVLDAPAEMPAASRRLIGGRTPEGLWPSTRTLPVSFQSDTLSLPVAEREKPTLKPLASIAHKQAESLAVQRKTMPERKRTPLRGRNTLDQSENSKPVDNSHHRIVDQHRWPSRTGAKVSANSLTSTVDLTNKATKAAALPFPGRGASPVRRTMPASEAVSRSLQKPTSEVVKRASFDGTGRTEYGIGTIFSVDDDSLPVIGVPKFVSSAGVSLISSGRTSPVPRPIRTHSLPISGCQRPPSPIKSTPSTPSSRGMLSPSRMRPSALFPSASTVISRSNSTSSVLSFIADVRKGKKGANHIEDAHQLRLLYNKYLQWRFVNAQTDTALAIQKLKAENILFNVWFTTSGLRDSVTMKRINLRRLRQEMKLNLILKEQIKYLDDWALTEREHSSSLSGAIETLEASTLHLPVTGVARADIHSVKNAVSSAVDVLQAMGSSICSLLSKFEGMNHLVSELADVAAQERALLDECGELLASTAAMQVEESSLRTHLIQLKQAIPKG